MRKAVGLPRGIRQADGLKHGNHPCIRLLLACEAVGGKDAAQLLADTYIRVQCLQRVLKNNRDALRAQLVELSLVGADHFLVAEANTATDLRVVRQQSHDRERGLGFAGARLADQAERLAGVETEA